MFDFILRKFVPFGLARTLSLAGIPLLQFAVMYFCSKEEAGKFYFVSNAAFVATQIGDLGMSRAFPVLFAAGDQPDHPQLPGITLMRWALGLAFGLIFVCFNQFGGVRWEWSGTGLIACLFCLGRVILLGNQGYRHARQEYTLLLRGSAVHILASLSYLAICTYLGRLNADIALAAITLGIWSELVTIDSGKAHEFSFAEVTLKKTIKVTFPYATVGIAQAIYGRAETFVAGKFLSPAVLGVFGTLDSAFKMCIWPSYVSAQTVFPAINQAVRALNLAELKMVARRHFKLALGICLIAMLVSWLYWHYHFHGAAEVSTAALFLWLSIWMSIPSAFMIPLYYSMGLERLLALSMMQLAIFRILAALVLAFYWGFIGLCATHAVVTLTAVALLFFRIRKHLWEFARRACSEPE